MSTMKTLNGLNFQKFFHLNWIIGLIDILNIDWPFGFLAGHQSMAVFSSANSDFSQPWPHSLFAVQIDPHRENLVYIFP